MFKFAAVFAVATVFCLGDAKHFDRCGLVQELRAQGFPEDKMANWVCIVEFGSDRYTDKVKTNLRDLRWKNYGLFQIDGKVWCSNTSTPGKACNVTCADLVTDDITKAAECAKKIYARHNVLGWHVWKNYCLKPHDLPDISNC